MREETIARNYAEALFEVAQRQKSLEGYLASVLNLGRLLEETPDIMLFLATPRILASEKKRVLKAAFDGAEPAPFVNFLLVTVDKRRQRLLPEIVKEFRKLYDQHMGRVHVDLTVARAMDDQALENIKQKVSELLGMSAVFDVHVEPEILGGIIARAGDTMFDGSVRRRLERMRRLMLAAPLPDGRDAVLPPTIAGASS